MIFFDSGPLLAYVNPKDPLHSRALEIVSNSLKGKYGKPVVSNYILDEVLTLARARTKSCEYGKSILNLIRRKIGGNSIFLEIILNKEMIQTSEKKFSIFCEKGLSFSDCTILAVVELFKIDHLASFDKHFEGLLTTIK